MRNVRPMIRRLLDWLGIASYPSHPRILRRPDLAIGVNVHADGSNFGEIKAVGFDTVLCDWEQGFDQDEYGRMLAKAKAFGLKTFIARMHPEGGAGDTAAIARELLLRHGGQIDYLAVRNEPDLAKFYGGTLTELWNDIVTVAEIKRVLTPRVKLVAPCLSSLGSSSRLGVEKTIRFLGPRASGAVDVIGQHIYRDTPDAVLRYYRHIRKVYRDAGWTQPFFISEFGWRSQTEHYGGSGGGGLFTVDREERQAKYVANTMAMLAKEPDVCGIGVYACNDDVAAKDYFGIRRKKAWQRVGDGLA